MKKLLILPMLLCSGAWAVNVNKMDYYNAHRYLKKHKVMCIAHIHYAEGKKCMRDIHSIALHYSKQRKPHKLTKKQKRCLKLREERLHVGYEFRIDMQGCSMVPANAMQYHFYHGGTWEQWRTAMRIKREFFVKYRENMEVWFFIDIARHLCSNKLMKYLILILFLCGCTQMELVRRNDLLHMQKESEVKNDVILGLISIMESDSNQCIR